MSKGYSAVWLAMQELGAAIHNLPGGLPVELVMLDSAMNDVKELVEERAQDEDANDPASWRPLTDAEKGGDDGDLMTLEDFRGGVESGGFIDYDGHGYPVRDDQVNDNFYVYPSSQDHVPEGTTHILWFNR